MGEFGKMKSTTHNKDKKIVHKVIVKDNQYRYLCNQAVSISLIKSSERWEHITCENCLKQKGKELEDER